MTIKPGTLITAIETAINAIVPTTSATMLFRPVDDLSKAVKVRSYQISTSTMQPPDDYPSIQAAMTKVDILVSVLYPDMRDNTHRDAMIVEDNVSVWAALQSSAWRAAGSTGFSERQSTVSRIGESKAVVVEHRFVTVLFP